MRIKTRYQLINNACQCQGCNKKHNYNRAPYEAWMNRHYSQAAILQLAVDASVNAWKWTLPELREIRDGLRQTLLDLGGVE
jgi:hypothetical protein